MQIEDIRRWCETRKQRAPSAVDGAPAQRNASLDLWALELLSLSLPASRSASSTALPSLQSLAAMPQIRPASAPGPRLLTASSALQHSQRSDDGMTRASSSAASAPSPTDRGFEILHAERGGMGVVSFCLEVTARFPFVIKTFREDLFLDRSETLPRFLAETRLWTELGTHPHIVRAYGTRLLGGRPYLFLELVPGPTLAELLQERGLAPADAVEAGLQICSALRHADRRAPGFVHGDLKPSNLLVHERSLKVTDFGLARSASCTTGGGGTPLYMAPEQWTREPLDARTDVYALGVVLYELLAGKPPFGPSPLPDLRRAHLEQVPAPLQLEPAWQPLTALVSRCLEKQPTRRPAVEELQQSLLGLRQPRQAQRLRAWGGWDFIERGWHHLRERRKRNSIRRILALGDALHDGVEETLRAQLAGLRAQPPNSTDLDRLKAFSRLRGAYPRAFVGWSGRGWDLGQLELQRQPLLQLCLPDAELAGKDLHGADLREADLRGADLRGANLRGADLREADLREADLRGACLVGADLRDARLEVAELAGVDLQQARTGGAHLTWAACDTGTRLPAELKVQDLDFSEGGLRLELWRGDALADGLRPLLLGPGIAAQLRAGISTERFREDFAGHALPVLRSAVRIAADTPRDQAVLLEARLVGLLQELWHTPLARDWLTLLMACDGQLVLCAQGEQRLLRWRDGQLTECPALHRSYQHLLPVRSTVLTPRAGDVYVLGDPLAGQLLSTAAGALPERCRRVAGEMRGAVLIRVVAQPRLQWLRLAGVWGVDFDPDNGALLIQTQDGDLLLPPGAEALQPRTRAVARTSRARQLAPPSCGLRLRSPDGSSEATLSCRLDSPEQPWRLELRSHKARPGWAISLDDRGPASEAVGGRRPRRMQLRFSPDGKWLGVLLPAGELSIVSAVHGRCRWRFCEDLPIRQFALDQDCRKVAYALSDGSLLVWSTATAWARKEYSGPASTATNASESSCGP